MAKRDYNDHMHTFVNRARVTGSRPRDHIQTIALTAGACAGSDPS